MPTLAHRTLAAVVATSALVLTTVAGGAWSPATATPTATSATTATSAGSAVCDTGAIEALSPGGASLGFLGYVNGRYALTASRSDADRFGFEGGTRKNVSVLGAPGQYLGLGTTGLGSLLALGSATYGVLTRTAATAPGAGPQTGSGTSAFPVKVESSIWSFDSSSHALTPTWLNVGGLAAPTTVFSTATQLGATGDPVQLALSLLTSLGSPTLQASCDVAQSITMAAGTPDSGQVGSVLPLSALGGGSGNPVTFSSLTPLVCSVDAATVKLLAPGTCQVAADQAASGVFLAASRVVSDIVSVPVGALAQVVRWGSSVPDAGQVGDILTMVATGGASGLPVIFSSTTPDVCSVVGTALSLDSSGTCSVVASQAGNGAYQAANDVVRDIVVTPLSQVITLASSIPVAGVVGAAIPLGGTGGASGLPVVFSSTTTGVCTVVSGTLHLNSTGTCELQADQAGNALYAAAAPVVQAITVTTAGVLPQVVGFLSDPPVKAHVGDVIDVTLAGGLSGNPVVLSTPTPGVCTVSGTAVTLVGAGTCQLVADQAGSLLYAVANQVLQQFSVDLVGSEVSLDVPTSTVSGQAVTSTATVSVEQGTAKGSVQFSLDGTNVGLPVDLSSNGTATSPSLTGLAGSHTVAAVFTPDDQTTYASDRGSAQLGVAKAASTTTTRVDATTLYATAAAVSPGTGVPGGSVEFRVDGSVVGTAQLDGEGTARLAYALSNGTSHTVGATYAGGTQFTGSGATTTRNDPTISAAVRNAKKNRFGWYHRVPTLTYTCAANGSPLTTACPVDKRVTGQGRGRVVTRTVTAADGGSATATTSLDIDRTKPSVSVLGVKRGARYAKAPKARCSGRDALSGISLCKVYTKRAAGGRVNVTATAVDRAGNRRNAVTYYYLR